MLCSTAISSGRKHVSEKYCMSFITCIVRMASYRVLCRILCTVSSLIIFYTIVLRCVRRYIMVWHGIVSQHVVSHRILCIVLFLNIVPHGTTVSYCFIVSYRIVSYRIVSYRIVSYRIVSYRIVSYRMMWNSATRCHFAIGYRPPARPCLMKIKSDYFSLLHSSGSRNKIDQITLIMLKFTIILCSLL